MRSYLFEISGKTAGQVDSLRACANLHVQILTYCCTRAIRPCARIPFRRGILTITGACVAPAHGSLLPCIIDRHETERAGRREVENGTKWIEWSVCLMTNSSGFRLLHGPASQYPARPGGVFRAPAPGAGPGSRCGRRPRRGARDHGRERTRVNFPVPHSFHRGRKRNHHRHHDSRHGPQGPHRGGRGRRRIDLRMDCRWCVDARRGCDYKNERDVFPDSVSKSIFLPLLPPTLLATSTSFSSLVTRKAVSMLR